MQFRKVFVWNKKHRDLCLNSSSLIVLKVGSHGASVWGGSITVLQSGLSVGREGGRQFGLAILNESNIVKIIMFDFCISVFLTNVQLDLFYSLLVFTKFSSLHLQNSWFRRFYDSLLVLSLSYIRIQHTFSVIFLDIFCHNAQLYLIKKVVERNF